VEVAVLTLDFARTTQTIRPGVALVQLHNELWRVTRPSGEVLGYIERFGTSEGMRFRAKRLLVQQRRFIVVGEFWGIDEALDCFA
jgi:hypothetical protein